MHKVAPARSWGGPDIAAGSPCFVLSSHAVGIAARVPGALRCVLVRASRTAHGLPATLPAADDDTDHFLFCDVCCLLLHPGFLRLASHREINTQVVAEPTPLRSHRQRQAPGGVAHAKFSKPIPRSIRVPPELMRQRSSQGAEHAAGAAALGARLAPRTGWPGPAQLGRAATQFEAYSYAAECPRNSSGQHSIRATSNRVCCPRCLSSRWKLLVM